ncbi:MAG: hypothetical protein JW874_10345 [Spirochaetales bacterium]|nr:hypothetical protein [Spirochaetales bacterium]
MKKTLVALLAIFLLFAGCNLDSKAEQELSVGADIAQGAADQPAETTKAGGNYAPFGTYLGISTMALYSHMQDAYNQYVKTLYREVSTDSSLAYILDAGADGGPSVKTEGMSYGMMIFVQMNEKDKFAKLWKFAKKYMQREEGYGIGQYEIGGFFQWQVFAEGVPGKKLGDKNGGIGVAPDGEIYFAMALIFAYNRWGITEYRDAARTLLTKMANYSSKDGNNCNLFYKNNLVKHWPIDDRHLKANPQPELECTNPSYIVPAFFDLYIDFLPSTWKLRDKYAKIRDDGRKFLKKCLERSQYRLAPRITFFDGKPQTDYNSLNQFVYDAWRVAMNITLDSDWNGKSVYGSINKSVYWVCDYSQIFCNFFESKNSQNKRDYKDQWDVTTGNTAEKVQATPQHSDGLVAMNAMAASLLPDYSTYSEMKKRYIKELWDTDPKTVTNYYQLSLYTLAMLWGTGNYKVY